MSKYVNQRAKTVHKWWQELAGVSSDDSARKNRGNPAAMAELRRARSALDALQMPESIELVRRVAGDSHASKVRVAELAALLAHVREDDPARRVAARLGGPDAEQRAFSSLRFRRLMQAEPGAERLTAFRRAVSQLRRKANVYDLADAWLLWDSPTAGERKRVDWMFLYVGAGNDETGSEEKPSPSQESAENQENRT